MNKLVLLLLMLFPIFRTAVAQPNIVVQVLVDSAFLRTAPDENAQPSGSVFRDESLVAVGRNADGLWFQVERPGRQQFAGWIHRRLVLYTFEVASLRITDLTSGVTGPTAVVDTGISVLITGEVVLRAAPDSDSAQLAVLPPLTTIPVLERLPDRTWLKVNYLGTAGWVAEYLTRTSANLDDAPVSPEFAPVYNTRQDSSLEIIPLEVQIDQIDRLLVYVRSMKDAAWSAAFFWQGLEDKKTVECRPPAADFQPYMITHRDRVELPELRRQERLLIGAVESLNDAVAAMQKCGVYTQEEISAAYADAINARGQLAAVERNMENLRVYLLEVP
jgi:hypothetical protein